MLRRVETLLAVDMRRLMGGTFHSVGNRLLRRFGSRLGLGAELHDPRPGGRARDARGGDLRPEHPDPRAALSEGRRAARPLLLHDQHGPLLHRKSSPSTRPHFAPLEAEIVVGLPAVPGAQAPRQRLRLRRPAAACGSGCSTRAPRPRRSWRASYDHVLVDEYQDTNRLQGEIVDAMARVKRNVTVVGDDAQAIYSFRGASFENILGFPERYPDAKTFRLTRNYRSTPEILALANASIAHNDAPVPEGAPGRRARPGRCRRSSRCRTSRTRRASRRSGCSSGTTRARSSRTWPSSTAPTTRRWSSRSS